MKPTTAEDFVHLAEELGLLPSGVMHEVWTELGGHNVAPEEVGAALVRREVLTGYQLERLLKGDRTGYFYGRAKVLYQIGAGSFARVFRAMHADTGSIMAVKVLRARYAGDAEKQKAFRHEGEMGRLLRHPNIVAIEDVGQDDGASYITMEFVEGQTLRELVRIRGAVDLPKALDLVIQMVAGLEYAHRRGVTHRDLKASNVLVSSAGVAKLVDFGLANVDESGDKVLGRVEQPRTVDYAALEKLAGMRDDPVRSDIYFLGTIAYLTLSGASALQESRDRAVRSDPRRFTSVQPLATLAPSVPREVVDVVARMMHLDPLERWQTVADVRRALDPLVVKFRDGAAAAPAAASAAEAKPPAAHRGSVMVVETSEKAQESMRAFFGKLGYRVLITENPQRALARFSTTPMPADCLVICAASLGDAALEAFNTLSVDPFFKTVPAILLLAEKQKHAAAAARTDERRQVTITPIQAARMVQLLEAVVAGTSPAPASQ
jgi:serine/threonine-protein kinase